MFADICIQLQKKEKENEALERRKQREATRAGKHQKMTQILGAVVSMQKESKQHTQQLMQMMRDSQNATTLIARALGKLADKFQLREVVITDQKSKASIPQPMFVHIMLPVPPFKLHTGKRHSRHRDISSGRDPAYRNNRKPETDDRSIHALIAILQEDGCAVMQAYGTLSNILRLDVVEHREELGDAPVAPLRGCTCGIHDLHTIGGCSQYQHAIIDGQNYPPCNFAQKHTHAGTLYCIDSARCHAHAGQDSV